MGHNAAGIDKTLTNIAVRDYRLFIRDICDRLASMYIELMYEGYSSNDDNYYAHSALDLGSLHQIVISSDNFGRRVGLESRWDLTYVNTNKSTGITQHTRQSCRFRVFSAETRDYLVKVVHATLHEMMRNTQLRQSDMATLQFILRDRCMDAGATKKAFDSYKFDIISKEIKETPSSSSYIYKFTM